ncbi:MAG: phosphomannomutase/phosphoglucomutase [bacterium]
MKSNIFREYDIRGIVDQEFKIEESYKLALSIITYFKQKDPNITKIIIGMDGRTHSPAIKDQAIKAVTEMGIDVIDIGLVPTPVFYFSLFQLKATSGFIITASHNPKEYNGIKICLNKKSIWGKQIQEIRQICEKDSFYEAKSEILHSLSATENENQTKKTGNIENYEIIPKYIDWITLHFEHLKDLNINAVIDCGNGTAGTIFPQLIKKMNWKNVKLLFESVDGTFPNHEADPTTYKNMHDVKKELETNQSINLGIGLDGDCDRMTPMTKTGFLVPGDQLLAVFAKKIVADNPGAPVVFDIKASSGLIELLKKWGAVDIISPSGHSLIKDALIKNNALLAGELSCHFFFNDRYFGYDDGIYAALRLFEIIHETERDLDHLLKIFPKKISSPEIRIECKEEEKESIVENVKQFFAGKKDNVNITIDGLRTQYPDGWGLVRASNTQPVVCFRFESDTKEGINKIKNDFYQALKLNFNEKELKEKGL